MADLGKEHGHRVLRVCGKGTKVVPIPLPPATPEESFILDDNDTIATIQQAHRQACRRPVRATALKTTAKPLIQAARARYLTARSQILAEKAGRSCRHGGLVGWPTGKLLIQQAARHKGDSIARELHNRTGIRPYKL